MPDQLQQFTARMLDTIDGQARDGAFIRDPHSAYVQKRPGGFFASCTRCGSDPFPDRRRLVDAEADAKAHGNLIHMYDRAELEAHEAALTPTNESEPSDG